jgi:SAM-dependent methyltransferase
MTAAPQATELAALAERIELWPIAHLRPYERNPRTHSEAQVDQIAADMARAVSGCEVWQQDMLAMTLPPASFDGVFANAVLFHVPSRALPGVLDRLHAALKPSGVLLVSNPRGQDEEGFIEGRYACFYSFDSWRRLVSRSGFALIDHYFRPPGKPRHQQPWLATLWRKSASPGERGAP